MDDILKECRIPGSRNLYDMLQKITDNSRHPLTEEMVVAATEGYILGHSDGIERILKLMNNEL